MPAQVLQKQHPLAGYLALTPNEDREDSAFSPYVPLASVPDDWNIIILMWAQADETSSRVALNSCFRPDCQNHETEVAFTAAVKDRVSRGSVVQFSIQSSSDTYSIDTNVKANTFVTSLQTIVGKYGFNGVDIDLNWMVRGDDPDFRTPSDASSIHLISAVTTMRDVFGPSFFLSITTGIGSKATGINAFESHLAVIHALRDVVDVFYIEAISNSGSNIYTDVDGSAYDLTTPEYLIASANLLLASNGTPVQNSSVLFPPLKAEQVFVLAELTHDSRNQYYRVNISTTHDAMACVARGENCHSYHLGGKALQGFRGFVADAINDDERNGGTFRKDMGSLLDAIANNASLPSVSPTVSTSTSGTSSSSYLHNGMTPLTSSTADRNTGGRIVLESPTVPPAQHDPPTGEIWQSDAGAPARFAVLQDAIRHAGFSVEALVTSLYRVAPEPSVAGSAEHPPTYRASYAV
ncbi:hypothetical protein EXIGLDRAFT_775110 [Exidia glandulosa HHB12029]|uniref:Uncharacterized protein n=1 Tax=Exidia glandulosa HHB12029 TaxID=1314781 RepID=A0A165E2E1_EXIGL|nr:hypothetical protein EXIGLDRAFT_775110 [Exidia glandulosa HHB12029]